MDPVDSSWTVRVEGARLPQSRHRTADEAERRAEAVAPGADIVVHTAYFQLRHRRAAG